MNSLFLTLAAILPRLCGVCLRLVDSLRQVRESLEGLLDETKQWSDRDDN